MKQFFKMFFASLLSLIIGSIIIVIIIFGIIAGVASSTKKDKSVAVNSNSVLLFDTDKGIHELSQNNSFSFLDERGGYSSGLYDILKAIEYAKTDKNIKGIMIRMSMVDLGWATMNQLRSALIDFKSSGKFIYAYGEVVPQKAYYLASVADSIYLNPAGFTEFYGLSSQIPFFKGTLEKLEVEPEIFYAGKYKSATEPFRCEKISEPNKIQIKALQHEIWNEFICAVAAHTKTDTATINQIAQHGSVQFPQEAVDNKIVNGLRYVDEVEHTIQIKTGQKADEKIKYVSIDDYANNVKNYNEKGGDNRIAVLMAEGNINDGESNDDFEIASKNLTDEIEKLRKNDKIKAVVLRVNSPGGSAIASEIILHELNLLKAQKPLIISMGDVAASGGYYISSQADSIFALPNTITGSIGVFTMLFNSEKLMHNKLGITYDQVKNAPFADFPTVVRELNDAERLKMQTGVDSIYALFKRRVATGRRMKPELVDSIAQGRVWSGTDALKIGLIDGLGNLNRAIASAAAKAKLKNYSVVTFPEPVDKLEKILKKLEKNVDAKAAVKSAIKEELNNNNMEWMKDLSRLLKNNGKVQMSMPFSIDIK
jgi:protease-4